MEVEHGCPTLGGEPAVTTRLDQERFHLVGRQFRALIEHQSHRSRDHRGSLRGARAPEEALTRCCCGEVRVCERSGNPETLHRQPRSDEVDRPGCRAAVREFEQFVVTGAIGTVCVGRADCDDERVDGRITQLTVESVVAGGRDHHDSRTPCLLCSVSEGIDHIALNRISAEGQVQDTDVDAVVVLVFDHPLDPGDHLGDVCRPRTVCHLDVHDVRTRSYSGERLRNVLLLRILRQIRIGAGDDSGHVGSVAVAVERGEMHLALAESNERSGPLRTFPSASSPPTGVTPESMTATPMPCPVNPSCHMRSAPITLVVIRCIAPPAFGAPVSHDASATEASAEISRTNGDDESTASRSDGTEAAKPSMISSDCVTTPPRASTASIACWTEPGMAWTMTSTSPVDAVACDVEPSIANTIAKPTTMPTQRLALPEWTLAPEVSAETG